MEQLDKAFEYCKFIMQKHAKTFYMAAQKLPYEEQKHFWSIYAYCRTVDDIADEYFLKDTNQGIKELQNIKNSLILSFNQKYSGTNLIFLALNKTFENYKFNIDPFLELIEGAIWDLTSKEIKTLEDLLEYSKLVAGSVGAMLLPIISNQPDKIYNHAYNYGTFMQIVNIIRDVGEDLKNRNRIYLPKDMITQYNISIDNLRNGIVTTNYKKLIEDLMEIAEKMFFENVSSINYLRKDVRRSIHLAGLWYLEILNSVRFSNYDNLSKRNYVPKYMKYISLLGGYKLRKNILKSIFLV
ncbi:MAG: phytoene/squalene synthase family protein [Brevinematales bacterium]|nr:phytoene/squalene synthase family protein [Brevinematales bacterium]